MDELVPPDFGDGLPCNFRSPMNPGKSMTFNFFFFFLVFYCKYGSYNVCVLHMSEPMLQLIVFIFSVFYEVQRHNQIYLWQASLLDIMACVISMHEYYFFFVLS